ncbi:MAG: zinc ABC transporter substrate-binding protein, partial [Candidatus Edwardsbacteria bacterium]|nr:zinc ABC transporter substrate-binding protein [Candidatus Edwardsbacteria bacterium]
SAEVFIINGGGMESFVDKAVSHLPKLIIVDASKDIKLIPGEGGAGNPHVWVSVSGAIQQVKNIAEGLAAADPGHAETYRRNAAAYRARLDALRQKMHGGLKGIKNREIITFHEAFPYFAKEFGLNIVAVIEREPGAGELAETVRLVRKKKIKALFAEPQYPAKAAETIARETGARVYILDPVSTGPMDDLSYYITAMEKNMAVLQDALR